MPTSDQYQATIAYLHQDIAKLNELCNAQEERYAALERKYAQAIGSETSEPVPETELVETAETSEPIPETEPVETAETSEPIPE